METFNLIDAYKRDFICWWLQTWCGLLVLHYCSLYIICLWEIQVNISIFEAANSHLFHTYKHIYVSFPLFFHCIHQQNTSCSVGQIRHMVYLMENALLNLPPDEEQMVWLIDFTGWSFSTAVSIRTTREATNILQNYYPERLGYAILYNPPRIFQAFWKVWNQLLIDNRN